MALLASCLARGLLPLVVAAEPPVHVEGDAGCPAPAEVAAQLAPLWPDGGPAVRARLEQRDDGVWVSLERAPGEVIGSRRLRAAACAERAEEAAVLLASWGARLRAAWAPPPAPVAAAPELRATALPAPPAPRRWTVELGASGGVSVTSEGAAAVVALEPGVRIGPVVARLAGELGGATDRSVGDAQVRWSRRSIAAGLWWQPPHASAWFWSAGAAAIASQLVVAGRGFAEDRRVESVDPGLAAHLRAGLDAGPVEPWVDLAAVAWPREQPVHDEAGRALGSVPRAGLVATVGVSIRNGR
jgi:hypothetical protein